MEKIWILGLNYNQIKSNQILFILGFSETKNISMKTILPRYNDTLIMTYQIVFKDKSWKFTQ